MQDLISGKVLTMSSREIAELTEKDHSNVKRDIAVMILQLNNPSLPVKDLPSFHPSDLKGHPVTKNAFQHSGNWYDEFLLDYEYSILLVSGYNVNLRQKIIKRWQELENKPPENPLLQLANAVLTAQKVIDDQSSRLALAEPKAIAFDLISDVEGELCLTDAAKHLQMSPSKLIYWLQVNKWIYKRDGSKSWVAYQQRIDQGLLIHRRATFTRTSGAEDYSWQALVTPKGISVLAKKQTIQEIITKST